jgi:hypothetical protein
MLFEAQIYDMSQKPLVRKIEGVLGMPAKGDRRIPDGIIDRFEGWLRSPGANKYWSA